MAWRVLFFSEPDFRLWAAAGLGLAGLGLSLGWLGWGGLGAGWATAQHLVGLLGQGLGRDRN